MSEFKFHINEKGGPTADSGSMWVGRGPKPIEPEKGTDYEQYRVVAAPEDITIMIAAPRTVGFYAETTPTKDLQQREINLKAVLEDFRRRLGDAAGPGIDFQLDFLFDYERQSVFDDVGVLGSEVALQALKGTAGLEETREWLRLESQH
jgi:hypothetical protein